MQFIKWHFIVPARGGGGVPVACGCFLAAECAVSGRNRSVSVSLSVSVSVGVSVSTHLLPACPVPPTGILPREPPCSS